MGPRKIPGWTFILTYGYSLDIYGYQSLRIAIDRETGEQRLGYVKNGK